ncbi:hypothetical protein GA0070610_5162 [Micromonospora echinofusca]|uniref:Uncharacterized protein n=1 Tax=Micromonospora echinofusca TaxID=47858 RepID=A0A1C5GG73_MICEH|nr:hypothetical protein [Micromonospora echinofusca]SCG18811.1 hypothetical protein GA0070610_5162 [Micromonospora echinofusca]
MRGIVSPGIDGTWPLARITARLTRAVLSPRSLDRGHTLAAAERFDAPTHLVASRNVRRPFVDRMRTADP